MGTIKIGKLIYSVICMIIFISVVNCYGAEGKAEEFFKQGEKNSTVENADKAIFYYSEAIKINPKFAQAYNNRGAAYVLKKKYDLAISDFNKAIELDPKYGKAYNNRAIVYTYEGETDKARQDLHKARSLGIAVDPAFSKKIEAIPSTPESIFHKPAPSFPKAPEQKQ